MNFDESDEEQTGVSKIVETKTIWHLNEKGYGVFLLTIFMISGQKTWAGKKKICNQTFYIPDMSFTILVSFLQF